MSSQSKPKKWKIPENKLNEIKDLLLNNGATEDKVSNEHEIWRVRIGKSVFTLYSSGTLFNNQATSEEVLKLRDEISSITGSGFKDTGKEIRIGLDETGKGELFGHTVLAGIAYPAHLIKEMENVIGVADTKTHKTYEYWDKIFVDVDKLRGKGLDYVTETIPPWHIDKYNVNKIMDVVYKKIISDLTRKLPLDKISLVLDNYQIGDNLQGFLASFEKRGVQIIVEEKADDNFLEAKFASAVAKRLREKIMKGINERFKINGVKVGSGNAADRITIQWLNKWKESGKPWPWFVKQSFSTIRKLDNKIGNVKKTDPPIKHELISKQSRKLFDEGKLSTNGLTILCPYCGSDSKSVKVTPDASSNLEGRCIKCNKVIDNLNTTLLYYNGCIIPDSSSILAGLISKDLQGGKFFENFTILLHPRVAEECDNKGGKAELGRITDIASYGRIRLITIEDLVDYDSRADDEIVSSAEKNNGIILTRDMGQYAKASGLDVFVITSK